ncbi:MAG: RNase adapter RapZ [Deltaproteobacteria bacterium]|nr:RNase adapter RapZ [Deltaproteobacteria bacterium]
MHVIVVTGMSGAGRSTALNVLEDLGFFCVDNLPPALAPGLLERVVVGEEISRVGLGVDVRTRGFLEGAEEVFEALEETGHEVDVLFLDSADDVLVRRFSETRRPHPLSPGGDVLSGIRLERERLGALRARAGHVIDTTELSVHDLRRALVDWVARGGGRPRMVTRVISFGFKYGVPVDADLVFDLRYLPNPHFVPELRPLLGTDPPVRDFVLALEEAQALLEDLVRMLTRLIPLYEREGKAYLTIAMGCTGGHHRSVALAEELAQRLREGSEREFSVSHRDAKRGPG